MARGGDMVDGKLILYDALCGRCGHRYGMHTRKIRGRCEEDSFTCDCPNFLIEDKFTLLVRKVLENKCQQK